MRRAPLIPFWLSLFLFAFVTASAGQRKVSDLERDRMHAILDEVAKTIEKNFYDPQLRGLAWKALLAKTHKTLDAAESNGEMLTAISSVPFNLQDSHTIFIPPGLVSQPLFGFEAKAFGNAIRVYELKKDGAAAAAGLQLGDQIVGVNGFDADRQSFDMMMLYLRALQPVGQMEMTIVRGNEKPRALTVNAKIKKRQVLTDFFSGGGAALWELIREAENADKPNEYKVFPDGVGYVHLPAFYGANDGSMRALAKKVDEARGFVVDLRGNPGGSVDALESLPASSRSSPA